MTRKHTTASTKAFMVGSQTVAYTLTRANRKTIGITIHPDLRVEVRAPRHTSEEAILEVLQKRARWIMRHLTSFAQRPPNRRPSTRPQAGTYLFLGQQLPLRVVQPDANTDHAEEVKRDDDNVTVWLKRPADDIRLAALLERWSRGQAEMYFWDRIVILFRNFAAYSLQLPTLKLRKMRARWGSCSASGTITLNVKLIHLDPTLIDYVIMHELCHLIEHNHSPRYYALLASMMPDWRARRQQLNEVGMPE